ncbi:MAG: hypothetical protein FWC41_01125 [Firmicutes bacterium]|nr:hypothetical protein [Bacillota bacterium]
MDYLNQNINNISPYRDNMLTINRLHVINPAGAEWDLAIDGTMSKRENNRTDLDIVHTTDRNGNKASSAFKAGTIVEMTQTNGIIRDEKGDKEDVTYDYMDIKDDAAASQFFEFVADHTNIEWAHVKTGTNDNRIGTSYKKDRDSAGSLIVVGFAKKGIKIREDTHSHPNIEYLNPYPSKLDFYWAKFSDEKFLNKAPAVYKVYSAKNKEYYQYFKNNQWIRL